MTKAELVEVISQKMNCPKTDATEAFDTLVDAITEALVNGESVNLTGIGAIKIVERQARTARNPRTGETIQVPAKKTVKLTPSSVLKNKLN